MKNLILALRLIAAAILLQTLFFKFTSAPESQFIFSSLGVEPWGRWIAGFSELIASVFLLWSRTQLLGAITALGIMCGALLSHIFVIGIIVQNDGGLLFALAVVVALCSVLILFLQKQQLIVWVQKPKLTFKIGKLHDH